MFCLCFIYFSDFCQTNYLSIYRTVLHKICRVGRTLAVDERSKVIFSICQRSLSWHPIFCLLNPHLFITLYLHKKLSYCRGTVWCAMSVEILPTATQQCRNHLYDKSWTNWHYEVADITLYPYTEILLWQNFLKYTMYKSLTWPWPRPLREHSLITRLRLHMADTHTRLTALCPGLPG